MVGQTSIPKEWRTEGIESKKKERRKDPGNVKEKCRFLLSGEETNTQALFKIQLIAMRLRLRVMIIRRWELRH